MSDEEINVAAGVDNVTTKLDEVFKKNTLVQKIEDIETFETFKRSENATIKEYLAEFDKYVNKLKVHKIEYLKDVTGFKLLRGANIPPNEEKLIRATIADIEYDSVINKFIAIYGDDMPANSSFNLKFEPTFFT